MARLAIGVAAMAAVALFAALGSSSAATTGKATSGASAGGTIGWSTPQGNDPALQLLQKGMETQAAKFGLKVITADSNLNPSKQISDVQVFVAKKVKAIVVWPLDDHAIQPALAKAKAAHIPVIAIYDLVPSSYTTDLIYTATEAGTGTADWFAQNIGAHAGVAAILGPPQVDQFRQIAQGFQARAKQKGLKVLASQIDPHLAPTDAVNIVSAWKTRFGSKLQGVFVALVNQAAALSTVVGPGFSPKIATYGGTSQCRDLVKSKFLSVCYYQDQALLGRMAAWAASQAIAGKAMPKQIYLSILPITQQNVASFPEATDELTKAYTFEPVRKNGRWTMPVFGQPGA